MRAYKCDDCGKLESGIATTVSGDGKTSAKDVGVAMDDFQSKLLDALLVRVSVARDPIPPQQECPPVELCAVCRAVAVIKAGIALARDAGVQPEAAILGLEAALRLAKGKPRGGR
jgi:hypothetical protein